MKDQKEILKRLGPTIAFVAPLVLVILLAVALRVQEQSRPVVFSIEMAEVIEVEIDQPYVSVELTLRLENRHAPDIDLIASNDCGILRWYLLDNAGSFIQGQLLDDCSDNAVAEVLRGEGTLVRTTTLTFDARRLEPDERYNLMLQFWGYEGQARFRINTED